MRWTYVRYNEDTGENEHCPQRDDEGKITGKIIIGLPAYFDENPDERIALGYIKCIHYEGPGPNGEPGDPEYPEYDVQTQYLTRSIEFIDENTCKDVYHVIDKSEEQLRLEELLSYRGLGLVLD